MRTKVRQGQNGLTLGLALYMVGPAGLEPATTPL